MQIDLHRIAALSRTARQSRRQVERLKESFGLRDEDVIITVERSAIQLVGQPALVHTSSRPKVGDAFEVVEVRDTGNFIMRRV